MAQEAILTVSLKDYKKQIDDLRASLLNLESTSKEYQAIADEIRDRQEKLNEVMGVGKKEVDAVAGSYYALTQEMSALKKEWKTLEIGSDRWVELGQQIDAINNKLKDADESVGVFGRNVGNYQQAFEGAMKSMLSQLGSINPVLGKMGSTVSQLIPVIKNVTKAATTGLKGIKAAIVSTGIGALIVALGVLASYIAKNWDAIKDWATGMKKVKENFDDARKSIEKTKYSHEQYIKYLQGIGTSAMQIQIENVKFYNKQLKEEEKLLKSLQAEGKKAKELTQEQAKIFGEASKKSQEEIQALNNSLNSFVATQEKLERQKGMTELEKKLDDVKVAFDDAVEGAKTLAAVTGDSTWLQAALDNLEKLRQAAYNRAKQDEAKKKWQEEARTVSALTKTIADSFKTRRQLIEENYAKEKKLLEKHHKDTTLLTKKYVKDLSQLTLEEEASITGLYAGLSSGFTYDALERNLVHAQTVFQQFTDVIGTADIPGPPLEKTIALLQTKMPQVLDKAYDMGLVEIKSLEELAVRWQLANNEVYNATKALREYDAKWVKLQQSLNKMDLNKELDLSTMVEGSVEALETEIKWLSARTVAENTYLEAKVKETGLTEDQETELSKLAIQIQGEIKLIEQLKKQVNDMRLATEQLKYDNLATLFNTNADTSGLWSGTNFKDSWEARIRAEGHYLQSLSAMTFESQEAREAAELEHQNRLLELQREYNKAKIQNYSDLAAGISSIFSSIGDIYAEDIANQVENGKKSKQQAEKDYKNVQRVKIATATIDTIQGALAAFMGYQELGQPWGAILGAIAAAGVTAAGVYQIQQIKNTNPYKETTPSSNYTVATPTLKDYTPEYFSNVTGASDTAALANALADNPIQAYVVESSVTAKQELSQQREQETTF